MTVQPHVFLSHASEDDALAVRLGHDFLAAGIDTFLDKWDVVAGDSLRRRIDQGLGSCTHFVVLLTDQSIAKPWVNAEIDAAFVEKLRSKCAFLPIRFQLPVSALPPLLGALHSPSIDDYDSAVPSLIADIYGVSKKPPIGPPPAFTRTLLPDETGLSAGARQVALLLIRRSQHGRLNDPRMDFSVVANETQLPEESLVDAAFELEELGLVHLRRHLNAGPKGFDAIAATDRLFVEIDPFAMSWNPEVDAFQVASRLVSAAGRAARVQSLAEGLCWSTRRINPAVNYLLLHDLIRASQTISHPYAHDSIFANERTRRWLKQNG